MKVFGVRVRTAGTDAGVFQRGSLSADSTDIRSYVRPIVTPSRRVKLCLHREGIGKGYDGQEQAVSMPFVSLFRL